ncbi:MAG: hypothetical protein JWM27_1245 [Gemmatimonadetes bacterium]|nr:hypothetical protein [Gemmatimonadota bacterium]
MGRPFRTLSIAAALALGACRQPVQQPQKHDAAADVSSSQVLYGMHFRMTHEGLLKADLNSDTATMRPGDPKVDLKGVRLDFFDEVGKPSGHLTSRTGEFDQGTNAMIARGGVVLVMRGDKGPRTVHTEELHYDQRGDRVWSEQATTMEQEGKTYHGTSFQSNTKFSNLTVQSLTTSGAGVQAGGQLSF